MLAGRRPAPPDPEADVRAVWLLPGFALLAGCEALNLENPFDFSDSGDLPAPNEPSPDAAPCVEPGIICTFAGVPGTRHFGAEDIPATESPLFWPTDVVVAPNGDVYVMDHWNNRIRRVGPDGLVRTVSGTGMYGDGVTDANGAATEGPALEVAWAHPTSGAFPPGDGDHLWVAAWHNSRVNRLALDDDWVHFEAGDGSRAFGGDGGDASLAQLDLPSSVVFDDDGNLYVSDQFNQVIRRVDPEGVITTIAGIPKQPGYAGDGGPALMAQFHGRVGDAADPSSFLAYGDGVLYIADTRNQVVRGIDLESGLVRRVAGTFVHNGEDDPWFGGGVAGYGGDGGPPLDARLSGPGDLAVGSRGELYVADTDNHCVRVVEDGIIDTFAGVCGTSGNDAHGVPARDALLDRPFGVAVGPDGAVYIADYNNHAIRVVR